MRCGSAGENRTLSLRQYRRSGFSLIELVTTLAIIMIVMALAVPLVQGAIAQYKLKSAVMSVTGVIQITRYHAISSGYPYRVAFDNAALTYQIQSDPNSNGGWANVGTAVPFASSSIRPTLNANITLQFRPNGAVSTVVGALPVTLTLGNTTETIAVSNYGNIKVTP
jgi:prepilin-type N-terminal cleavage/methylation domain-containing protein